ncbi:Amino Acid-Polyamine-Organocation (APC) Family [Achlya hypogyna]|uniref:Amino Acid-Polyamine-Organocation (APC) Family n=1 Tax=Achlya hypogyna TaxID=1202772 RepID=A0A1V9YAR7_ACHHY|nr:Amino Acid-Polyamine-Organocation (APC) Family [Achlya hypogyna]
MVSSWLAAFGRVKPLPSTVHTPSSPSASLKRCLTTFDLLCYGVGCSVGAGVYSLIGIGAEITGPSISVSFLVGGIACIFTSLTYSEFAARVPITGSAYTFVYVTFGELAAWLIGWNLTLGYGISSAGIARSWAAYVTTFLKQFGVIVPPSWVAVDWGLGTPCSAIAAILILVLSVILLAGVHESAKFNAAVTALNIAVLLLVISVGSMEVDLDYWQPFAPEGIHGIMQGAGVIFFSYLGFDMVACLAEEVPDPQKNVPRGIIGSLLISISIYVGVSLVVTGMAPVLVLGTQVPLVNAFDFHGLTWVCHVISYGSMFGLTTAAFTCLMGQPRIFYQMSKDGLLPAPLSTLHATTRVPYWSTIVTGLLVSAIAFFFDLDFLANVISCGTLMVFTFVNAGVLELRYEAAVPGSSVSFPLRNLAFVLAAFFLSLALVFDASLFIVVGATALVVASFAGLCAGVPRTSSAKAAEESESFRCPWVPLVPCLGIVCNIYMMMSLPPTAWVGVAVWMAVGMSVYLCYGMHHSALRRGYAFEQSPLL